MKTSKGGYNPLGPTKPKACHFQVSNEKTLIFDCAGWPKNTALKLIGSSFSSRKPMCYVCLATVRNCWSYTNQCKRGWKMEADCCSGYHLSITGVPWEVACSLRKIRVSSVWSYFGEEPDRQQTYSLWPCPIPKAVAYQLSAMKGNFTMIHYLFFFCMTQSVKWNVTMILNVAQLILRGSQCWDMPTWLFCHDDL